MTDRKYWYVKFPTYQYEEDAAALAKEQGLTIIDARFDAGDGVAGPKLTVKGDSSAPGEPELLDSTPDKPEFFDVFKVAGGERSTRASKSRLTRADAESWVAARPDTEYVIISG